MESVTRMTFAVSLPRIKVTRSSSVIFPSLVGVEVKRTIPISLGRHLQKSPLPRGASARSGGARLLAQRLALTVRRLYNRIDRVQGADQVREKGAQDLFSPPPFQKAAHLETPIIDEFRLPSSSPSLFVPVVYAYNSHRERLNWRVNPCFMIIVHLFDHTA